MRPSLVRHVPAALAVLLLAAACSVEGRIEGFSTQPIADVETVEVTPDTARLAPGETVQLQVTARDASGLPVAGIQFTWQSFDNAIASVDAGGLVTANALTGTTGIRASAGAVASDTAVVIVERE